MTEGDRAAANGWHPCRWVETLKSAGDSASHPYGCGRLAGETSGRRLHATAGKGASVNACAGQMLGINERLNSLAGYDMREQGRGQTKIFGGAVAPPLPSPPPLPLPLLPFFLSPPLFLPLGVRGITPGKFFSISDGRR
jgi:hypothetical protein